MTSLPAAVTVVAWFAALVVSVPSSSHGGASVPDSVQQNHTTVLSTKSGNNSYVKYNVSYNNTKLELNCPGDAERTGVWTRPDGSVLCTDRRCVVNVERRLTNDDSGDYVCRSSVANGTEYHFVHVNVLAPPKLLTDSFMDCYGTDRNQCTVGINGDFPVYSPTYSLNASFDGNGPIRVQWYRNRDKFDCSLSKVCTGIISKPNYQILSFQSFNLEDAKMMSGLYSAAISNPYGTNESFFRLQYSCTPTGQPQPVPNEKTLVHDLVEGATLNASCGVIVPRASLMFACFTKNLSATFDDLHNDSSSDCVMCNGNDVDSECSHQTDNSTMNSLNNITVSRLEIESCPGPTQFMNFVKDSVSLDDSGKIICAYATFNDIVPYQSVIVKVTRSSLAVVLGVLASLLFILAVAIVIVVVVCRVRRKRRQQRQEDSLPDIDGVVTIQVNGEELFFREDEAGLATRPLLRNRPHDSISQYGSVAPQDDVLAGFHLEPDEGSSDIV